MPAIMAMAISVGFFGGIATWSVLSVGTILLWGVFTAWASFFAAGGDNKAIMLNIACNSFGSLVAWAVAVLALSNPVPGLPGPAWIGILVAASIIFFVLSSQIPALGFVPGIVFGYATTFAYLSQTPGAFAYEALLSASLQNVLPLVVVSMAIGTVFGAASAKGVGILSARSEAA
ncbi:DUF1097 domain-containing protein [Stappia sp. GBMRC 2046]|uniref:DUF1097 domain-containing protein n=1 Tax=Stappia sediminis TaxID=2692190 RepID=A0A7X3SA29_9HYPH|nr:DUF1097 domain-containing protein [Stappia sediminis]MXN67487.1 DUF1097 domain-containing protein [Stappia sediminis]